MSDRPPLMGETRSTRAEIRVLNGIVYAGLIGLLLVFGARMFVFGERNGDAGTTQQALRHLLQHRQQLSYRAMPKQSATADRLDRTSLVGDGKKPRLWGVI